MTIGRACEPSSLSTQARLTLLALTACIVALGVLFGSALGTLWRDWIANPNYSHGALIVPASAWLAWQRRRELREAPVAPSALGLALVGGSLALFAAGTLAAEIFTTRLSIVGVIAGTILFVCGPSHLRIVAFPVAFLLFMIPLPALVFDRMTASLQFVASDLGEHLLRLADVPVLRDGNVLTLSTITLNVTEACSGIRSLVSLLAFASLGAYLVESTRVRQAVLTLSAVPLAIVLNGVRLALTGIAAVRIGPEMARGVVHEATGWATFALAVGCIGLLHWTMDAGRPARSIHDAWEAA